MGRTIPSFRIILEREIQKWEGFVKALRDDDKDVFEELMNVCRCYTSAAGAATRLVPLEAMFMSILLSHQKLLKELTKFLEKDK